MIKSLYIISPGGVPVYYYDPASGTDKLADAILFSGLISAIRNFLVEVDIGEPEQFTTKSNEVYLEATNCFAVVLIKEIGDGIPSRIVKELISELTSEISKLLPDDQACNVIEEDEAEIINGMANIIIKKWQLSQKL
ncbi:MAG: hypothetical protein ACFFDS_07425 [Candidatus Thorarchaeota archaeon]